MAVQLPTTLDSLSAADSAEFEKRLSVYGLDASAVLQPDLVVPANTTMTLSASDPKSFMQPRLLNTTNLSELKTWIGIPDTLFQAGKLSRATIKLPTAVAPEIEAPVAERLAVAPVAGVDVARAALPAAELANTRVAANAYLFGDSALVAGYKTAVEKLFPNFQIIFWPFLTITVNPGSILTIGPGQNVLFAWKIVIHEGGVVYAPHGNLKVDSVILQKA
jgi:hypothetical protein